MRAKSRLIALLFGVSTTLLAVPAFAQDTRLLSDRLRYFELDRVTAAATASDSQAQLRALANDVVDVLQTHTVAFVQYVQKSPTLAAMSFQRFLQDAECGRVDEQVGAAPGAGAATTTASRTGLSSLLAFALEAGAVTQTIDHNVVTVRGNADGLLRFLSNRDVLPTCVTPAPECDVPGPLKDLEVSATFNVSDSGATTLAGTTTAASPVRFSTDVSRRQLQTASLRYAVSGSRDLRSAKYRERFADWFTSVQQPLAESGNVLIARVQALRARATTVDEAGATVAPPQSVYALWQARTRTALLAAPTTTDSWMAVLSTQLDELTDDLRRLDPAFDDNVDQTWRSFMRFAALRRSLETTLVTDPALTLEYTFAQPSLQPTLHSLRAAWALSPGNQPARRAADGTAAQLARSNPGTVTMNLAVEFYDTPQAGAPGESASRWKDVQAALQFDRPLGAASSPAQLTIGAYYQYQMRPSALVVPAGATMLAGTSSPLLPGTTVLTNKGHIVAAQGIVTLKLGASGMKIPIGLSWANRTELVTGSDVRGHVGVTFDPAFLLLGAGR